MPVFTRMRFVLPSELSTGDDGVVVGERFAVDGGSDFGHQAADAAALARAVRGAVMTAALASRVPGAWALGDHDVVKLVK